MVHPNEIELPHDLASEPDAFEILRIWLTPDRRMRLLHDRAIEPEPWGCAVAELIKCIVDGVREGEQEKVFRAIVEGYLESLDPQFLEWRMRHADEVKRRQRRRKH